MMNIALLGLLVTGAFAAAPKSAPDSAPSEPGWTETCAADIEKLCANKKNRAECLATREAELTEPCKKSLELSRTLMRRFIMARPTWDAACAADQQKNCPKGGADSRPLVKCMMKHGGKLSPTCRKTLAEVTSDYVKLSKTSPQVAKVIEQCLKEQTPLCPGSSDGFGLDIACLKSVRTQLTSRCRAFVDNSRTTP
jgi:hypothetical protein